MFTFRRLTLLFFIIFLAMNLCNFFLENESGKFFNNHSALFYSLLFIGYFGISFAMAFLPCSNFHHPVICKGITNEKIVAVTFDDGPDPVKTPIILEVLKKYDIPATFFCIGKNLDGNEQLLKKMVNEGHLVGNHSFSHSKLFDLFPARRMRAELLKTDSMIRNITGISPLYFRPPFGVVNPMVGNALKKMHWQTVCWNIRSLDTMRLDHRNIINHILLRLKPGSIILLHDFTPFVENHLHELLSAIGNCGYKIVPLDKLLKLPAYV